QHHAGDGEGGIDDHGPQAVGDQVPGDDAPAGEPQAVGGLDELLAAQALHLAAHDARHGEPLHGADGEEQQDDVAPEHNHQQDDEDHDGQGVEDVHQPHHHGIDPAPRIAGDGAPQHADHQRHASGDEAYHQRHAPAPHHPGEQV